MKPGVKARAMAQGNKGQSHNVRLVRKNAGAGSEVQPSHFIKSSGTIRSTPSPSQFFCWQGKEKAAFAPPFA
jgi:nitrate reductase cytochrome c-type subunit